MKPEEQLKEWLKGNSIHNSERDECCPDFSCCQKDLLAPLEERTLFVEKIYLRDEMLMIFLGRAFSKLNKDVYIIDSIKGEA